MFDQYLKSRKNKIIIAVLVASLILFVSLSVLISENKKLKDWKPITREITLEYGSIKKINEQYFVDKDDKVEVVNIELEVPLLKNEEGQTYYALGSYNGILSVQLRNTLEDFSFKLNIKDTIAPKILKFSDKVIVAKGYSGNFSEYFEFEDVDDVTVNIERNTINTAVAGTYKSKVIATDQSYNKTEREFFVEVVEDDSVIPPVIVNPNPDDKEEIITKTNSDITSYVDIRYAIKRIADPTLFIGEEKVVQTGNSGVKEVITRVYYENDVEVRREVVKESIVKVPQDEIIHYGTREKPEEVEGAFNERPKGLVYYETLIIDDILRGKEYYISVDDAIIRGEDLISRNLITEYQQGTYTKDNIKYYYIVFNLE